MWASQHRQPSQGLFSFGRTTLGPLLLMSLCPLTVLLLATLHTVFHARLPPFLHALRLALASGSLAPLFHPPLNTIAYAWDFATPGTALLGLALAAVCGLVALPPRRVVEGPVTPGGRRPRYRDNGFVAFAVTVLGFVALSDVGVPGAAGYPIEVWTRHLPELMVWTNGVSWGLCVWLYVRGAWVSTRSADYSTLHHVVGDFYTGRELHPRFPWGGIDVKQFTNCRFGMMLWALIVVSAFGAEYKVAGLAQMRISHLVAFLLQMGYLGKFFWWERGYFATLDMMHDRAGFYLCWGCINWVPCVYAQISLLFASSLSASSSATSSMPPGFAIALLLFGLFSLYLNYAADAQKVAFRAAGNKVFYISGKRAKYLKANYKTKDGQSKQTRLLLSGYWGTVRHFNYLAELMFAYAVGLTAAYAGLGTVEGLVLGLFYPVFLTILLVDRCYRDEARCRAKYGKTYERLCKVVRYRMVPGVF